MAPELADGSTEEAIEMCPENPRGLFPHGYGEPLRVLAGPWEVP